MQLFYYDKNLKLYEGNGNYRSLINYLEQQPFTEQIFSTIVAYSWYLYSEGKFISTDVCEDWKFYLKKWIQKLESAKNLQNYPLVCLICAYTLEINGMNINNSLDYKKQINDLYNKAKTLAKDNNILALLNYLTSKEKTKLNNEIIKILFPNISLLDNYFIEVLS